MSKSIAEVLRFVGLDVKAHDIPQGRVMKIPHAHPDGAEPDFGVTPDANPLPKMQPRQF